MSETAGAGGPPAAGDNKKEKKGPPPGLVIPPKKPKLSKAERRALQEQQRAAKASKQQPQAQAVGGGAKTKAAETPAASSEGKLAAAATEKPTIETTPGTSGGGASSEQESPAAAHTLSMVSHLTPFQPVQDVFHQGATLKPKASVTATATLHPAVIQLGYRYAAGDIRGGNARCRHMLACWQQVLRDFQPTSATDADLRTVVDGLLKASFQFWTETCRPHSVSMGNAYTMIKTATASLDRSTGWQEIRDVLIETMQAYTRERIDFAGQAIADLACSRLLPDDKKKARRPKAGTAPPTILVYGYSEVVSMALRQAAAQHKPFSVICVDSRPLCEGRRMLQELRTAGVKDCTYILLNALTYVLPNVTTVLVGAAALMSDGAVWNRVGTANVALLASAHNIPVLVCAESYKISNRVQLEALTHNEMGAPPANPQEDGADDDDDEQEQGADKKKNLTALNLLYDLTPASFVSGIVTELGIVPPTSVAVLLRELNSQQQP